MMALPAEVLKSPGVEEADKVRLTLVRKLPGNAELPT
jgi:hypothetical protein